MRLMTNMSEEISKYRHILVLEITRSSILKDVLLWAVWFLRWRWCAFLWLGKGLENKFDFLCWRSNGVGVEVAVSTHGWGIAHNLGTSIREEIRLTLAEMYHRQWLLIHLRHVIINIGLIEAGLWNELSWLES